MFKHSKLIPAVHSEKHAEKAIKYKDSIACVYILFGNISNLNHTVEKFKAEDIPVFVHIEKIDGLKLDTYALKFLKNNIGVDGILTTKTNIIKSANKIGLKTILRSFLVDQRMLDSTIQIVKNVSPTYLEIMPALTSYTIKDIEKEIPGINVISSGLVDDLSVYNNAIENGSISVSTSNHTLWKEISRMD